MSDFLSFKEKEISPNLNSNLEAATVSIREQKFKSTDSFLKKKRKNKISKEELAFIKEFNDLPIKRSKEDFLREQKRREEDYLVIQKRGEEDRLVMQKRREEDRLVMQKRRDEDFIIIQKRREEDFLKSQKVMMISEKIMRMNYDSDNSLIDEEKDVNTRNEDFEERQGNNGESNANERKKKDN